ncbi:GAF domain-containing protein [Nocardioides lijunqiniae]|uniref:GAF domain-containing protein n=1 Tax=Nocardioides lijunqiniae TaxID=2760832 RepID=UPI0018787397
MADAASIRRRVDAALARRRPGEAGMVATLDSLCAVACQQLPLTGAAITLVPSVGSHTVAAASSATTRELEEAQFGVGEGPTRDAFTSRRPVLVADLTLAGLPRWPGWAPVAVRAGAAAAYALPLHVGASIFGVLTLYAGSRPLDPEGLRTALVLADIATDILLDGRAADGGSTLPPDLGDILGGHAHVYQAQGMVMVALGVGLAEALVRMRAHAWATGQDLGALATEIVSGRQMPTADPG